LLQETLGLPLKWIHTMLSDEDWSDALTVRLNDEGTIMWASRTSVLEIARAYAGLGATDTTY